MSPLSFVEIGHFQVMRQEPVHHGVFDHRLALGLPPEIQRAGEQRIRELYNLGQAVDADEVLVVVHEEEPLRQFRKSASPVELPRLCVVDAPPVGHPVLFHRHLREIRAVQIRAVRHGADDDAVCSFNDLRPEHPVVILR